MLQAMCSSQQSKAIEYVGGYTLGYAGTSSDINVSLTSLTGGTDSSPQEDDLVIVSFGNYSSTVGSFEAGWTTLYNAGWSTGTYRAGLLLGYKFMSATPDTIAKIVGGTTYSTRAGAVGVMVFRNVNQTTTLDVAMQDGQSIYVKVDPPSITPVTTGTVLVSGGSGGHVRGTQTFGSTAGEYDTFLTVGGNDDGDVTIGLGWELWEGGAYNPTQYTFTGTDSSSFPSIEFSLALRPE